MSIPFEIPKEFLKKILNGEAIRSGALIKDSATGQILGHLKEGGNSVQLISQIMTSPVNGLSGIAGNVQLLNIQKTLDSLQMISTIAATTSVLNLGISVAGFALVLNKLEKMDKKLDEILEINKEILKEVKKTNQKLEDYFLAELEVGFNSISKAENAIHDKINYLEVADPIIQKSRNLYRKTLEKVPLFETSSLKQEHVENYLQRFLAVSYATIQIEVMKDERTNARAEVKRLRTTVESIKNDKGWKHQWYATKHDDYVRNLSLVDGKKNLEESIIKEGKRFDSIMDEILARLESFEYELTFLDKNKLTYIQYKKLLNSLPDDIVMLKNTKHISISDQIVSKQSRFFHWGKWKQLFSNLKKRIGLLSMEIALENAK
ncbi:MAG: hypothetical protein SFU98_03470 [Leptospiraceae bacterium]|nr:hypothetical protein [Leptospiraceae bacterium]